MKHLPRLLAATLVALALPVLAGTAEVRFPHPEAYGDPGLPPDMVQADLRSLAAHVQALARQLPSDEVLKVEMLDVKFAGYPVPRRDGRVLRVDRNGADFPAIRLRYSIEQDGRVLKSGEQRLADIDDRTGDVSVRRNEPLHREMRLLDRWFAAQVAPAQRGG